MPDPELSEETVEAMANRYESALARGDSSIHAMRSAIAASGLVEALAALLREANNIDMVNRPMLDAMLVAYALISPPTKEGERT